MACCDNKEGLGWGAASPPHFEWRWAEVIITVSRRREPPPPPREAQQAEQGKLQNKGTVSHQRHRGQIFGGDEHGGGNETSGREEELAAHFIYF